MMVQPGKSSTPWALSPSHFPGFTSSIISSKAYSTVHTSAIHAVIRPDREANKNPEVKDRTGSWLRAEPVTCGRPMEDTPGAHSVVDIANQNNANLEEAQRRLGRSNGWTRDDHSRAL